MLFTMYGVSPAKPHRHYKSKKAYYELADIASKILPSGKGILAIDEDDEIMRRRFLPYGIQNTQENRRAYYEIIINCDPEINKYISAYILHPEYLNQCTAKNESFCSILKERNIYVGIRADMGVCRLPGTQTEYRTRGLDYFKENCKKYKSDGVQFAKFRCVYTIGDNTPSVLAMQENSYTLALFALSCHEEDIIPLVQVDVLNNGSHDLKKSKQVHQMVLATLIRALQDMDVYTDAVLLLTTMVVAGASCVIKYTPKEIALATVETLRRTVPASICAIAFTSVGVLEEESTVYLHEMQLVSLFKPWNIAFAFGRALTTSCLCTWNGLNNCAGAAQFWVLQRAMAAALASRGLYKAGSIPVYNTADTLFMDKKKCFEK